MISEDLMNGVAASISSGSFSIPFDTVQVALAPVSPANTRPLTATIGLESIETDREARCTWSRTHSVRVIISDYIGVGDLEAQAMARLGLIEEVVEHLREDVNVSVSGGSRFVIESIETNPHYSYEALIEEATFMAAFFITYKGYK